MSELISNPVRSDTVVLPEMSSDEQQTRQNKYTYEVFAGFAGERYLSALLQQILPTALWRTWQAAVSFQAPGLPCYVGVSRLTEAVKPGERKVYLDLAELEARQLLKTSHERLPFAQPDGSLVRRTVTVKDWSRLYDLAYEYHEWTHDSDYLPPLREHAPLIQADPQLFHKLIRFDNYRRILLTRKPGRKPKVREQHLWYRCQFDGLEVDGEEDRTNDLKPNLYFNTSSNRDSTDRIAEREDKRQKKDSNSAYSEERGVGGLTIRNSRDCFTGTEGTTMAHSDSISNTNETKSNPNPSLIQKQEGANSINNKKSPISQEVAAMVGIPDAHWQQLTAEQLVGAGANQKLQCRDERRRKEIPSCIDLTIRQWAAEMNENPSSIQSDITRAAKIYFACQDIFQDGMSESFFLMYLDQAKEHVLSVPNIRARNRVNGRANRMPCFFTCLENLFEFSEEERSYIRSDDRLSH